MPVIERRVESDGIVRTETFTARNALETQADFAITASSIQGHPHYRHHVNKTENFWNQARRHSRRFNGIRPGCFYWFLKGC